MLAEAKASIIHVAARGIIERMVRPVSLDIREGSTLDSAKLQDRQNGNFRESANEYYSVYRLSQDTSEQAIALIGLSQQLVNLGSFREARKLLHEEPPKLLDNLAGARKILLQARVKEKEGWINDYELGYFQSKHCFTEAGLFLTDMSRNEWGYEERELYSTTRHFLGRASYGLASLGVDRIRNTREAINYFKDAMSLDQRLETETDLKVGFGHGWLTRCYLMLGKMGIADEHLEAMRESFIKHLESTSGRGIMAHYHLLRGARLLQDNLLVEANDNFAQALAIRTDNNRSDFEMYPKGEADACLGLSKVALKRHDIKMASRYLVRAFRIHPYAVLRSTFGG